MSPQEMKADHPLARRKRARGARLAATLVLGALGIAFFRAQVLRSSTWALRADSNRLRPLAVSAPRGTIFDREGRIIADNVPGYSITLLPGNPDSLRGALEGLRPYLSLSDDRVEYLMGVAARYPRQPLLVEIDADFDEVSALAERRFQLPGVYVETRPRRRYHAGPVTAHAIGYLGEITPEELEDSAFAGYEPGMVVGQIGVERQYEGMLQGREGVRYVEVDATGRIVGSFMGQAANPNPAIPGRDIHLNLDLELMEFIHHIFPDTMRGAVVALNVEDGGILALYSSPTYDPNDFVGGIDLDIWEGLSGDPAQPLFNRAVLGLYPPASTWKLATAAIGLELGVVTPGDEMPIECTGGMFYGDRVFGCWEPEGHGFLDLAGAVQHSCDVYFYQLGLRIGLQTLLDESTRIGFSRPCGIDLPQESAGIFPEDGSYWERVWGYRPTEGEVLNLAIGQGPNSQTPLKMAQFYVAIARDGTAPTPLLRPAENPAVGWSLDISQGSLETLREGLRRVFEPGGTAHLSSLEHWEMMGKTGTGENPQDPTRDHAWFAGMAGPRGEPSEIVVVTLVEFGEHGSSAAAPISAKAADFYLRRKYGIPVDTIQTLRDHLWAGRPAPWADPPTEEVEGRGPGEAGGR